MDNLFTGNIWDRNLEREDCGLSLDMIKYEAILFKTDDGNYIDYENLEAKEIMPALDKSSSECIDEKYQGLYVDSESLKPYIGIENDNKKKPFWKR